MLPARPSRDALHRVICAAADPRHQNGVLSTPTTALIAGGPINGVRPAVDVLLEVGRSELFWLPDLAVVDEDIAV